MLLFGCQVEAISVSEPVVQESVQAVVVLVVEEHAVVVEDTQVFSYCADVLYTDDTLCKDVRSCGLYAAYVRSSASFRGAHT